jgi:hypothetical protein
MKRTLIAGLVGGIVIFVWSAIAHTILPIGTMGVDVLPSDEAVLPTLQQAVTEPGLYFFPGMDMSGNATPEEQQAWDEAYRAGPIGLLIYSPTGEEPMPASTLILEFLTTLAATLFAAWVLGMIPGTFGRRVAVATLFGVVGWLSISVSEWIWYPYPGAYIIGVGLDQVIGWLLGGLAMAALLRPKATEASYSAV